MATFKVGQRVRVIAAYSDRERLVGREGYITSSPPTEPGWHSVSLGIPNCGGWDGWEFPPHQLAPILDTWAADKVRELVKPKPMDQELPSVREVIEQQREIARSALR